MKSFTTQAYIASLNLERITSTQMGEIIVLEEMGNNNYKVQIKSTGAICTAIFNPFRQAYYADDIYGII